MLRDYIKYSIASVIDTSPARDLFPGALELMVPVLAKELKPLRINAVSPGVIDTPWWDFLPEEAKNNVFADFSSKISAGRVGRPEEVAATVRFILTTEYINGIVIGCHGGLE